MRGAGPAGRVFIDTQLKGRRPGRLMPSARTSAPLIRAAARPAISPRRSDLACRPVLHCRGLERWHFLQARSRFSARPQVGSQHHARRPRAHLLRRSSDRAHPRAVSATTGEMPSKRCRRGASVNPRPWAASSLARRTDGHYYAKAEINGQAANDIVDTGASMVALTEMQNARACGLSPRFHAKRQHGQREVARFALVRSIRSASALSRCAMFRPSRQAQASPSHCLA